MIQMLFGQIQQSRKGLERVEEVKQDQAEGCGCAKTGSSPLSPARGASEVASVGAV